MASFPLEEAYIRLHISPLNPTILSAVIPPSMTIAARNITYHSLQTFPEKTFGYVDLPLEDAAKLKKKLNGTILKGTKMRIEDAREMRKAGKGNGEEALAEDPRPEEQKSSGKKRKWNGEVLPGAELKDRKVKRGWTDEKAAKKAEKRSKRDKDEKKERVRSKYTTGPECLFKTGVPANIAGKLEKKDKAKEGRSKGGKEAVLVHEFEKTVKHATFLRDPTTKKGRGKQPAEFVEGKGWVDADGAVVEEVKSRKTRDFTESVPAAQISKDDSSDSEDSDSGSSESKADGTSPATALPPMSKTSDKTIRASVSDTSSEEDLDDSSDEGVISSGKVVPNQLRAEEVTQPRKQSFTSSPSNTSSSAASSSTEEEDSDEDSSSEISESKEETHVKESTPTPSSRPVSSSGAPSNLSITIPPPPTPQTKVHPLEALYKRKASAPEDQSATPKATAPSFSFFDTNGDDIEEDTEDSIGDRPPMTPFTAADMSFRGLRSAAPTPDTAHPSRFGGTSFPWSKTRDDHDDQNHEDYEDEDEDMDGTPTANRFYAAERKIEESDKNAGAVGSGADPNSDFQKWFWENRGEVNRGWKKRRKVVGKEKRQKENRKRGEQRM